MPSGGMQRSSLKIMRAEIFIILSVAFITMLHFIDAGAYGPCLTGKCYVFFPTQIKLYLELIVLTKTLCFFSLQTQRLLRQ